MDLLRERLRAQGRHRAQVAAALIGSAVVGGVVSSSASKSAANTQAQAADNATAAQTGMFNTTVGLEAPFRQTGIDAMSKLNNLLGIGPQPAQGGQGGQAPQSLVQGPDGVFAPAPTGESEAQIRDRLAPQFAQHFDTGNGNVAFGGLDENALNAAVQAELQRQQSAPAQGPQASFGGLPASKLTDGTPADGGDQSYGSLLKPFGMDDFQLDPGIQFQIQQGNQALTNSNAAQNGTLSGAALKSLIGFNQQMAGTGYQSAFDRYMAGKSFTLGSLKDMVNTGQAAAGNTVNAAPSFSSGIAGTIQGAGNAQAAGAVGSANALSGALTGTSNAFLLRNLLGGGGGTDTAASLGANSPLSNGTIFGNGSIGD